mmetsp:Transcript_20319/g.70324  ORF Transcript_20319/g.70324 Transcript_20319/m.70324 type:complete len:215 (-) Transcript_20319:119-763(-)
MVLSNWAILAILTSVVSDNMISSSNRIQEEEAAKTKHEEYTEKVATLQKIFREVDADHSGAISEDEWNSMMEDRGLLTAMCTATDMTEKDLRELFRYLAVDTKVLKRYGASQQADYVPSDMTSEMSPRHQQAGRLLYYTTFVEHLRDDNLPADKRSVLKVLSRMQGMEVHVEKRLDEIWGFLRILAPNAGPVPHVTSAPPQPPPMPSARKMEGA